METERKKQTRRGEKKERRKRKKHTRRRPIVLNGCRILKKRKEIHRHLTGLVFNPTECLATFLGSVVGIVLVDDDPTIRQMVLDCIESLVQ